MESFFCAATGKKLPGKHGQQDLIACPLAGFPSTQHIEKYSEFDLARLSL
jgi:hypothetical protein